MKPERPLASATATARSPLGALATTLLLVLVPAVYFANDLGGGHPQHTDVFYTLLRSLNLLETGDWLSLHYNFAPDFKKPPLQYMHTAINDREVALDTNGTVRDALGLTSRT